eukprot:763625-Hanusia_phi.AAC.5
MEVSLAKLSEAWDALLALGGIMTSHPMAFSIMEVGLVSLFTSLANAEELIECRQAVAGKQQANARQRMRGRREKTRSSRLNLFYSNEGSTAMPMKS